MPDTMQETVMVPQDNRAAQQVQEAAVVPAITEAKQRKRTVRKKVAKKSEKVIAVKSKRKTAVARASVRKGTGNIRINGFDISTVEPVEFRDMMLEPIMVSRITEELSKRVDIKVNVDGGGKSAQAQAVRGAIAKGIAAFADTDTIRKEYVRYDRSLLIDDPRRVEPKKFKGPKARARFQKSYR
jgi:small subunit ribosomal protein S9